MIAFTLLESKEFSLPDGVSAAIIGLFFGLICGLFYYQHYYKSYFWAFSLAGGLVFTILSNAMFAHLRAIDNTLGVSSTIASFAIPFVLTLALNYGLQYVKRTKRKRKKPRQIQTEFFESGSKGDPLSAQNFVRK